jgi:hypothetical protein
MVLSNDNRFVLSWYQGSYEAGIGLSLWDVASRQCVRTFKSHGHRPVSGCLSIDNKIALSGSDHSVKLWDIATGHCLRTFRASGNSVCLSVDGRFALFGGNCNLELWDIAKNRKLRTLVGHQAQVQSVCWSLDGRFALSGSGKKNGGVNYAKNYENTLKLWDIATGQYLRTFEAHEHAVVSLCFSADSRYALSGSYDGTVKLWDIATGGCLQTFTITGSSIITSACLSQDVQYVLAAGLGTRLWILDWELEDRQPADWDEGARSYLENFLTLHMPYVTTLSTDCKPSKEEIKFALSRCGRPVWTEGDFQTLLHTLGCAGYGWLHPEGVHRQLMIMANSQDYSRSLIEKFIVKKNLLAIAIFFKN